MVRRFSGVSWRMERNRPTCDSPAMRSQSDSVRLTEIRQKRTEILLFPPLARLRHDRFTDWELNRGWMAIVWNSDLPGSQRPYWAQQRFRRLGGSTDGQLAKQEPDGQGVMETRPQRRETIALRFPRITRRLKGPGGCAPW